jgi:C4-dicarboxylate-specific signal transduction histidine kinase
MGDFFAKLFSSDFMPHGYCYLWDPGIVWLHAASDGLIAFSYYLIPLVLIYFVRRRRDLPFHWMFLMFGLFIFGCGTTHLMEVWTLWHGTYRLAGVIKALTAVASLATASLLVTLLPKALALPSPAQLRAANLKLEKEISERLQVEEALEKARADLETKVQQRTAELARANLELRSEIAERQRAEDALQKSQAELAHATRVMTMGELTASIAHEVNQPLAAVVTNGSACLRWLAGPKPNLEEARNAVARIIKEGNRASEVITEIRSLVKKSPQRKEWVDINTLIGEVVGLVRGEMVKNRIVQQSELAADLPRVYGDRIQLQQVLLNLMVNAIEAMNAVSKRSRELMIGSQWQSDPQSILVSVRDSGSGLDARNLERAFDAFFTTKPEGMGMGLSIGRSIIAAHGGRLWAGPNADFGTTFRFTIPANN